MLAIQILDGLLIKLINFKCFGGSKTLSEVMIKPGWCGRHLKLYLNRAKITLKSVRVFATITRLGKPDYPDKTQSHPRIQSLIWMDWISSYELNGWIG
jgi:hypothetical protein